MVCPPLVCTPAQARQTETEVNPSIRESVTPACFVRTVLAVVVLAAATVAATTVAATTTTTTTAACWPQPRPAGCQPHAGKRTPRPIPVDMINQSIEFELVFELEQTTNRCALLTPAGNNL
jgi:hypothetical protein